MMPFAHHGQRGQFRWTVLPPPPSCPNQGLDTTNDEDSKVTAGQGPTLHLADVFTLGTSTTVNASFRVTVCALGIVPLV